MILKIIEKGMYSIVTYRDSTYVVLGIFDINCYCYVVLSFSNKL